MNDTQSKNLWSDSLEVLFTTLESSLQGLSHKDLKKKYAQFGKNTAPYLKPPSALQVFTRQFKNPLIIILIIISLFSFVVGEITNGAIILTMLFINAFVGFIQEFKAEKSVEKLKRLIIFKTKVIRNGKVQKINSMDLVPGDIVFFNVGDLIPADIRLITTNNLSLNEATLTGESLPIVKNSTAVISDSLIPQNIKNGVFMGTSTISGSGKGIVIYTGAKTFFGETIQSSQEIGTETYFQKNLKNFTAILLKAVFVFTIGIFLINAILGRGWLTSFFFAVTLALGITPEVLPIIVTMAISNASYRLSKKNVIVKRLSALEDIGNIDVLCSDKTGTITEGKLKLTQFIDLSDQNNNLLLEMALICNANNANVKHMLFDNPIDLAIFEDPKAIKLITKAEAYHVIDVADFDFEQKEMSILVSDQPNSNLLITKGAMEVIIERSDHINIQGKISKMTSKHIDHIHEKIQFYEDKGYRAITLAYKESKEILIKNEEQTDFIFLGFLLFLDPPRKSLTSTLEQLKKLEVQLKIITGDSPIITKEICNEAGLEIIADKIISGEELEQATTSKFNKIVNQYNVFARVTPDQKFKIIQALQQNSHVVGYIGDGINDVSALEKADVGISVDSGTDVTKDCADIVLLKKDLSVLIDGIIEGRKTFSNTIKFILNVMSASYGNVITLSISSFFLKFIPLLPSQLILADSVNDIHYLTISTDNVDEELLHKPRKWDMKLLQRFMLFFGVIGSIFDFLLIGLILSFSSSAAEFRTVLFVETVLTELVAIFAIRTQKVFFRSKPGIALICSSLLALFITIILPFTKFGQKYFEFVAIDLRNLIWMVAIVTLFFIVLEIAKQIFYRKLSKNAEK
ncbi:MAG: magnesium-translocating P-type ATPase [bacterium]